MDRRIIVRRNAIVVRVGGPLVSAHLLADGEGLALIDAGLWGAFRDMRRVIARLGRRPEELRNIVLTHGHLDHVGGAAEIQAWSGARIWAHAADREHVAQRVSYRGVARVCGLLESVGRAAVRLAGRPYLVPEISGELRDGDALPLWGGLRVRHLPGHTPGHCVLLAEREEWRGLVFSGDLFASYAWSVHAPPRFLSRDTPLAGESLHALAAMRPAAVLPSHYDRLDPTLHARRLQVLTSAMGG